LLATVMRYEPASLRKLVGPPSLPTERAVTSGAK